jgi:hypothetical protein
MLLWLLPNPILTLNRDVCFWHKTDIAVASLDVRFWGKSGHRIRARQSPLMTRNGHPPTKEETGSV